MPFPIPTDIITSTGNPASLSWKQKRFQRTYEEKSWCWASIWDLMKQRKFTSKWNEKSTFNHKREKQLLISHCLLCIFSELDGMCSLKLKCANWWFAYVILFYLKSLWERLVFGFFRVIMLTVLQHIHLHFVLKRIA